MEIKSIIKKSSKIFCLIVMILTFSSCRGVPAWLVKHTSFELTDEAMSEIQMLVKSVGTDVACVTKDDDQNNIHETFYVNDETCLWWAENSLESILAYCDGILYEFDYSTEKTTSRKYEFNAVNYEEEVEKGYEILNKVLTCDISCFNVDLSYKVMADGSKNNYVSLEFNPTGNDSKELEAIMPGISFVEIGFIYDADKKTYSEPYIKWQTKDLSYSVSFDVSGDGLLEQIDSLRMS